VLKISLTSDDNVMDGPTNRKFLDHVTSNITKAIAECKDNKKTN